MRLGIYPDTCNYSHFLGIGLMTGRFPSLPDFDIDSGPAPHHLRTDSKEILGFLKVFATLKQEELEWLREDRIARIGMCSSPRFPRSTRC